ncbi:DUF4623 domain-containing protein [Lacipirellula parvula]|uniref:Ice-binding protein C-terminal domain-containing protein n=1 Tax=Lacipirellula parvula TaxID=2650471 RepID=A0A5K7XBI3_9BACT|nr:DUF4623 domain-containing protein [Lacipirellula parvula]BBO33868.1 hypothetical protein PLANPX_3480 [Lacipirellula parvula]
MKSHQAGLVAACAAILCAASPAIGATLTAKTSFGGGDGWRAPFEVLSGDTPASASSGNYRFLGNAVTNTAINPGNTERGFAYNPTSGNLLLVSRGTGTDRIRILDGQTGVDKGSLDLTGITGGTFAMNMIGVADDGAIYMANLAGNVNDGPFKIYRWANEAAVPTVAYIGGGAGNPAPPLAGTRLGDSFDVIGSGANTRLVAGYGSTPSIAGSNGFALFDTDDGATFMAASIPVTSSAPFTAIPSGEFRLGISFVDSDTIVGKSSINPATVVDISGATAAVSAQHTTDGITLRPMDFAVVAGIPVMAMVEATTGTTDPVRSRIFVYDMTNPALPLADRKLGQASALPGPQATNANSVGQVKFGAIVGNTATIYAMSTNNGIQAFELTVIPEPTTLALAGAGLLGLVTIARRRAIVC